MLHLYFGNKKDALLSGDNYFDAWVDDKDIYTQLLPCKEPAIFVVDDSTQNYLDIEFKDLMYKSNAYFIIISRKKLVYQREDSNGAHKEYLLLHDEIYTISTIFR